MNADDFQGLYKLLRGSKSAMPVLDAKALYSDRQMVAALEKLNYARDAFLESRSRLLKQDVEQQVDKKAKDADRQIKKLKRKQDKLLEIVKGFDELISQLQKLADRERERDEKREAAAQAEAEAKDEQERRDQVHANAASADDVSDEFSRAFARVKGDERLDVVAERFGFCQVESEHELLGERLYLIQAGSKNYLVRTPPADEMSEHVAVVNVIDDRPIKPFSREDFLKLGTRRKMVLLMRKEGVDYSPSESTSAGPGEGVDPDVDSEPVDPESQNVLDMGAFSQLLMSAQRCGLVPGADQIGHVRDREFRKGQYDLAFQAIDSLFSRFTAAASQRNQQLIREDADIASGRVKISPKDLQAKRSRDRAQTQEVERAKRRFQVVLEGLRVLMNTVEASS